MRRFISLHPVLSAVLLLFACTAPAAFLRDFSPSNELRYLSIADEAVRQGHMFAFTMQGEAYADKPPLYLWLVMLSKLLLGRHSMAMLCLFSLAPAAGIMAVTDKWLLKARPHATPQIRAANALMVCTSALMLGMSIYVRMDMLMVLLIVLSMSSFLQWYEDPSSRSRQSLLMPLWIFLALFTKGPVGLLAPSLGILVFLVRRKQLRRAGEFLGCRTWGIIAGLCMLWFAGVYMEGGTSYLKDLLLHQTFGRAVNSFHHKEPVYQYLIYFWEVLAPWCLACAAALALSLADRRGTVLSPAEDLLRATVLSTLVLLTCFSSKTAYYLMPAIPPAVTLRASVTDRRGCTRLLRWCLVIPAAVLALAGAFACTAPILAGRIRALAEYRAIVSLPWLSLAGAVLLAFSTYALISLRKDVWRGCIGLSCGLLLCVLTVSPAIPETNPWIGYGSVCACVPEDAGTVYTYRMRRPESMDVYLGRDVKVLESEDGIPADASGVLIAPTHEIPAELKEMPRTVSGPYSVVFLERKR